MEFLKFARPTPGIMSKQKIRAVPFLKSPMNYIGGKYKLLPQIMQFFPAQCSGFIDLFAGGLNVALNVPYAKICCNDVNHFVIDIYRAFQSMSIASLLACIDATIAAWELSSTNEQAYYKFRDHYNHNQNPVDLYILICHSFNYQVRFNSRHEYNNPFGRNRSWFNPAIRQNLVRFHARLADMSFTALDFRKYDLAQCEPDAFVYCDPPYLITCGSYNDGKRGFEGWTEKEDNDLFAFLDEAHARGLKFALSNVVEHKGQKNSLLWQWMQKYHTHYLNYNYNNSNYQTSGKNGGSVEVLITNY